MGGVNDGGPAFPRPLSTDECESLCNVSMDQQGMSLRDWFAGQALTGMFASTAHPNSSGPHCASWAAWAADAYEAADAMLKEREK